MKKYYLLLLTLFIQVEIYSQAGGEDCATATTITAIPFTGNGSTLSAIDNYNASCWDVANAGGAKDHVYKYTTGSNAEYLNFSLCVANTNYDSQLYIYENNCAGIPYACREDGCQSPAYGAPFNSEINNLMLNPNTTYYIVIDGYNSVSNGNYQLNITPGVAPAPPQIPFTDMTHILPTDTFYSGNALGIADMNGDKRDDIIRAMNNTYLFIDYQQSNGTFTETDFSATNQVGTPWGMCIADVNNDGYNDMLWGEFGSVYIMQANSNATAYNIQQVSLSAPFIFVQGANFFDIDNDGLVDAFVCNDVADNHVYKNNGNGNWQYTTSLLNTSTVPSSDNSGNYASIWSDINNDGYMDLYITHCRQGVTNSNDPRRINQVFWNNGNGIFTQDIGNLSNLRIGAQSWSTDFADIDNDGDMDAFVLNYDVESMLMENNGNGVFTNITAASGISGTTSFFGMNAVFKDFNNDGFVDLFLSGTEHRMYINNGDKTFTLDQNAFNYATYQILSQAVGDLNHDGFLDIYASYADVYNNPSPRADKLWMNNAASGYNYLVLNLQGVQSNRNGIGAIVKLYGPWGVQVREVRSGEAYGIHNSFAVHFGLKNHTQADSLVVLWPSGITDKLTNIGANQFLDITEGSFATDLNNLRTEHGIFAYPNPAHDNICFMLKGYETNIASIAIYDISGKIIETINFNGNKILNYNCNHLKAGVYYYCLQTTHPKPIRGKFIKN
jgi:hypothetical protein